ncbi:iron chaperone [Parapedobacter sp. GCM10030251]|uniref:iron chaperone n=1 Tax=Parapedobacter sp. GCM10030251 TaxID=3273419 RepID=UPI00361722DD
MENVQTNGFKTVDEYLATITDNSKRALLDQLRRTIKHTVPDADEVISYQMPAYHYKGILIYFAAWKNHWALYPASATLKEVFKKDLSRYKQTKGAIQFPWDEPFPEALVTKLVRMRADENLKKAMSKTLSKKN